MEKYSDVFNLKLSCSRFCEFIGLIFLLFFVENTIAQNSRVAVINRADSNLVYKHIGFTEFQDKTDTFDCQFNCKKYIDQELTRILSTRYTVSFISVPNSLLAPNESAGNLLNSNKEIKSWITNLKQDFDFVIFVETGELDDIMETKKQKLRSGGLYSRGNSSNSWVAVFSTINFTALRPSNSEVIDYDWSGMDYLLPISEFQFPRQNLLIDPDMLPVIKTALIKLLDYKLEYFLTNSFLVPNVEYDKLKLMKPE